MRQLLLVLALLAVVPAGAAEVVREGEMEVLILDGATDESAARWSVAEATLEVSTVHTHRGETSLHFHVPVDWETGEPNYPVGWPRITKHWPDEALRDWTQWDFLEFSVYSESSRKSLPAVPMGLALYLPDRDRAFRMTLAELALGEWVDFRIPIADMSNTENCVGIQFHIAESNYTHGDTLDFYFDHIRLTRYINPVITAAALIEEALFGDTTHIGVELYVMGLRGDATMPLTGEIWDAGQKLAESTVQVSGGKGNYFIPVPAAARTVGMHQLRLRTADQALEPLEFRIVKSPWEEG